MSFIFFARYADLFFIFPCTLVPRASGTVKVLQTFLKPNSLYISITIIAKDQQVESESWHP